MNIECVEFFLGDRGGFIARPSRRDKIHVPARATPVHAPGWYQVLSREERERVVIVQVAPLPDDLVNARGLEVPRGVTTYTCGRETFVRQPELEAARRAEEERWARLEAERAAAAALAERLEEALRGEGILPAVAASAADDIAVGVRGGHIPAANAMAHARELAQQRVAWAKKVASYIRARLDAYGVRATVSPRSEYTAMVSIEGREYPARILDHDESLRIWTHPDAGWELNDPASGLSARYFYSAPGLSGGSWSEDLPEALPTPAWDDLDRAGKLAWLRSQAEEAERAWSLGPWPYQDHE